VPPVRLMPLPEIIELSARLARSSPSAPLDSTVEGVLIVLPEIVTSGWSVPSNELIRV
jgi:hypothetical protein